MCCRSQSAQFCIVGVNVILLLLGLSIKKRGRHIHNSRWAFDGIKVGNTITTGGYLVVFRWAFGGWYTGGKNMRPTFGNGQNTTLVSPTANEQKPAWPQLG